MKVTPESFAPILAKAISDAWHSTQDDDAPMKAMISGLAVFRDLILGDYDRGQEKIIPGFVILRHAMTSVMAGHNEKAKQYLEQYAREFPQGVFARAVTEDKVFGVMTLGVPPLTRSSFCFHCKKPTTFIDIDDGVLWACEDCGCKTRLINRSK